MKKNYLLHLFVLLWSFSIVFSWNILEFGARPSLENWHVAQSNAEALLKTVAAANASRIDRTVVIPQGHTFYMYAANMSNLVDVTFEINGVLKYTDEIKQWPTKNFALLYFTDCEGIHVHGTGMIDGQGMKWWRYAYSGRDYRPDMLSFKYTRDIVVSNLYLYSSPKYSINFVDCADIVVHDVTIFINSTVSRGRDHHASAVYALNTDGIDIAAYNVTVYNNHITNYDDGIVAKPCRSTWKYCQCAGAILAYNNTITYSTGLTIGSVPPNNDVNCVRNVTFRNNTMHRPLKAIYIKPNPGTNGVGIIEDIMYEDIAIDYALWWTVWIGPQQQNQPGDKAGTGCNFLFPYVPTCPTQPLVTMKGITLRNVHARETMPFFEGPGVILCDAANPCTNFVFANVTNTLYAGSLEDIYAQLPFTYIPGLIFPLPRADDDWTFAYVTTNVYGRVLPGTDPKPCFNDASCFWTADAEEPLNTDDDAGRR